MRLVWRKYVRNYYPLWTPNRLTIMYS
jgi:hypothetical protein